MNRINDYASRIIRHLQGVYTDPINPVARLAEITPLLGESPYPAI